MCKCAQGRVIAAHRIHVRDGGRMGGGEGRVRYQEVEIGEGQVDGKGRMMGACTLPWTGAYACGDAGEGNGMGTGTGWDHAWTDTCANVRRRANLQYASFTYVMGGG